MQQVQIVFQLLLELERSKNLWIVIILVALLITLFLVIKRKNGVNTPSKKKNTKLNISISYSAKD